MRLFTATIPNSIVYFLDSPYRYAKRFCVATSLATPIQVGPAPAPPLPLLGGRTQEPHGGAGRSQPVGCAACVVAVMPGAHVGEEKHRAGALRLHLQALGRATAQPAGDPGQGPDRRTLARDPLRKKAQPPDC